MTPDDKIEELELLLSLEKAKNKRMSDDVERVYEIIDKGKEFDKKVTKFVVWGVVLVVAANLAYLASCLQW